MPNNEINSVVVIGAPEKIRRFVDEALIDYPLEDGDTLGDKPEKILDFANVVPEPEGIERGSCNGQHDPGVVCWLIWNRANWGTKWGAYAHSHYALRWIKPYRGDIYGRVDLRFETAWSQPVPIFEAIEERWGVTVHAVTQDEGGFPDVVYGDPTGHELLSEVRTFEFENWADEVSEPNVEVAS